MKNDRVAFLVSGEGKKFRQALEFQKKHKLDEVRTIFVVSDSSVSQGLVLAAKNRVCSFCTNFDGINAIKSKNKIIAYNQAASKKKRASAERAIIEFLREHDIEVIVMDGFRRKLSPEFKKSFEIIHDVEY